MPNTVQLKKNGQPVFPVTDVSLVMGLAERPLMDAVYAWDGTGTPDITKIPAGVTVEYNETTYTGTLAASADTTARFYLVPSTTVPGEYDRYLTDAVSGSYSWKPAGTTAIPTPSIVDNLESTDPTKALSAKQGKVLNEELGELEAEVHQLAGKFYGVFASVNDLPEGDAVGYAFVGSENPYAIWNFDGTDWSDSGSVANGITGEPGVGFSSIFTPQPYDGTMIIVLSNNDTITVDLNHQHPQYPKYQELADEAEYHALTTKESDTLYLIPESSS